MLIWMILNYSSNVKEMLKPWENALSIEKKVYLNLEFSTLK